MLKKKKNQGNFNFSFVLPDFLLPVSSSSDMPDWAVHTSLKDFFVVVAPSEFGLCGKVFGVCVCVCVCLKFINGLVIVAK